MKTSLTRLAPLVLLFWLLPACAELPGLPPPGRGGETISADESLFQSAEASYRRQHYTQAWQFYHSYIERYPKGRHLTEARLKDAELLGLQGNWHGSLSAYQAILAGQPGPEAAMKARYGIGWADFKLGRYQEASPILDSLTAASGLPRSLWFSTQMLLAEIALKQNNVSQAFSRLRLASQDLASGDREWFNDLKSRVVEAASPADLESLATMYRDSPLAAALVLRLAKESQKSGQPEEAQKWFRVLRERYPNSPEAASVRNVPGAGGKITLGCLLPLSGEMSNIGFRVQRGMELAARQAQVNLVFKDTQSDPDTAARLVQELAQDSQVLALVGPLSSGVAQAAAEAAQSSGLPLLALSQKSGLTQAGNLIFQAFLTPRQQVRALVRRTGAMGIKRFSILYPDSAYGRTFLQLFQEEVQAEGLEMVAQEPYASGTQDFSPVVTSFAAALQSQGTEGGAQALFIPDDAPVVAAVAKLLSGPSLEGMQLLGTNLLHNPRVTPEQLTALEGVIFPDAFFPGDPHPAVQAFVNAYRQQYGQTPDYLAAQGYVVTRLLGLVAASGGPLNRTDLPQRLMTFRGDPDLPWFRGFNQQQEEEAAIYLLTIKNGQIRMVTETP